MEEKIAKIKQLIADEKESSIEWYKDFLMDEWGVPESEIDTADKLAEYMENIDAQDQAENMHYTAGMIRGLQIALDLLI